MARVIEAHPEVFNAMVFGTQLHPSTMQFLHSAPQIQTASLTAVGQQFANFAQNAMQQVFDSDIARTVVATMRKFENSWCDDVIRELNTISQLQHAPAKMLRWVMANETLRDMHSRQEISGYEGRWFDPTPDDRGREHFEWRCVKDGVLEERIDASGEETFGYTQYLDEREQSEKLSLPDKDCVTISWEAVEHFIRFGNSDPTSEWNAGL